MICSEVHGALITTCISGSIGSLEQISAGGNPSLQAGMVWHIFPPTSPNWWSLHQMPQEPGAAECGPNPSGGSSSGRWAMSMALRNVYGASGSGSVGPRLAGETGDNQAVVCMVASRLTTAHAPAALPLF